MKNKEKTINKGSDDYYQADSKSPMAIILGIVFIVSVLVVAGCYVIYDYSVSPSGSGKKEITFVVRPGQGFSSVTSALVKAGIVTSPKRFKVIGALNGNDKKIKAGEYLLSPEMTPGEVISVLTSGKVNLYAVTIPEGYNIYQIADVIDAAGIGRRDDFLKTACDKTLMGKLGLKTKYDSFEGYLFPDTYRFPKGIKQSEVIKVMLNRFWDVYNRDWEKRAKALGFSVHEIVTLASIIEKETGDAAERPLISSVFHNRLKKRMRLETDPTVIYGIKDFDGNLTRKHLREKTRYNTYRIKGLPPGPIANPGQKSIEAALYPATSNYLFFVSKRDTTHQFSTNIRDHINSVRKYQLRR